VVSIDEEFEKSQIRRHTRRRKGRLQVVESYSRAELAGQKRQFKPGGKSTRAGRLDPKEKTSKIKIYTPEEIKEFESGRSKLDRLIDKKETRERFVIKPSTIPTRKGQWIP